MKVGSAIPAWFDGAEVTHLSAQEYALEVRRAQLAWLVKNGMDAALQGKPDPLAPQPVIGEDDGRVPMAAFAGDWEEDQPAHWDGLKVIDYKNCPDDQL